MKENVPVAQAATTSRELPPRVQEALGELLGVARCVASTCATGATRAGRRQRRSRRGRDERGGQLPAPRFVDLTALPARLRAEVLVALCVSIERHRRTRVSEVRRVVAILEQAGVASILELDATAVRTPGVRLFVAWAQDRIRLALSDPDDEFVKDVWDLRVFGKPQGYRLGFTPIAQPWLRELAKQWAREKLPLVHPMSVKSVLYAVAELVPPSGKPTARRADGEIAYRAPMDPAQVKRAGKPSIRSLRRTQGRCPRVL